MNNLNHHNDQPLSSSSRSTGKLLSVMAILFVFMLIEIIGGVVSQSLALISDAVHMGSDFIAVTISWLAARYALKPPDKKRSYGYTRFQIIAALINGVSLFVIAIFIAYEAIQRIFHPNEIEINPYIMLYVALIGLLANFIAFLLLRSEQRDDINIRSTVLHILGDILGSVAAVIAAIAIMYTNWTIIDPILSLLVSIIISISAYRIANQSTHILLEGAPHHINISNVRDYLLENLVGVLDVHHIHIWSLTEDHSIATMHLLLKPKIYPNPVVVSAKQLLLKKFNIKHSTIETEYEDDECADRKEP